MKFVIQKSPVDHPQFSTHKNYLSYMRRISDNLSLECNINITSKIPISDIAFKKVKLIKFTIESMKSEYKIIIQQYPEYAAVCVSWVPVKSYYVIFNLIILLEYLLNGNEKRLTTTTHGNSLTVLKNLIGRGELNFNISDFNEIKTVAEIQKLKIPRFENLRSGTEYRKEEILRKLVDYAHDELKRKVKTKRISHTGMETFRKLKLALFEFFYWYRIKVNYRDLEFISSEVTTEEFCQFYEDYHLLTANFYKAFRGCINNLSQVRAGINLL